MNLLLLLLCNPLRALRFTYTWVAQSFLVGLRRILVPHVPVYQSLRTQLHRAYLSSAQLLPEIVHRLPVGEVPESKAKEIKADFHAYFIPGDKFFLLSQLAKSPSQARCVVLFAHGGGYARGEAKMYMRYMERWERAAKESGLDLVFLSVEYRE
jgi:hypothetical protein